MPLALTAKSVCGSVAAQSCEGCAAVWIDQLDPRRVRARSSASIAVGVADVERRRSGTRRRARAAAARSCGAVDASGPKNRARMSFSMPITSIAGSTKCAADSEPISPPEPVMIAVGIAPNAAVTARGSSSTAQRASAAAAPRGSPLVLRSTRRCRRGSRAGRGAGRHPVSAKQPRAVREVDRDVAGRALSARRSIGTLAAGQLAAQRRRLQQREAALAAAADVDGHARPSGSGSAQLVARPGRPGRRRAAGRGPACPCRRSRCSEAAGRSGGRASSG